MNFVLVFLTVSQLFSFSFSQTCHAGRWYYTTNTMCPRKSCKNFTCSIPPRRKV